MAIGIRAQWEPMRELAFGDVTNAFKKVGTPLSHAAHQVLYQNDTDVELCISLNGTDIHFVLAAGKSFADDLGANSAMQAAGFWQGKGDQVWTKQRGGAPSLGSLTVSVKYAKEIA